MSATIATDLEQGQSPDGHPVAGRSLAAVAAALKDRLQYLRHVGVVVSQ